MIGKAEDAACPSSCPATCPSSCPAQLGRGRQGKRRLKEGRRKLFERCQRRREDTEESVKPGSGIRNPLIRHKRHQTPAEGFLPCLFSYDLYENALASSSVELPVKNALPWPEIHFPFRHRHNNFPAHDLAFEVGVPVVLACQIMPVP